MAHEDVLDIRETDRGFLPNQHCTYPYQDGSDDYSFSHTAAYCGRPQPRRCGCPFDYPQGSDAPPEEGTVVVKDGETYVYLPDLDAGTPFFKIDLDTGKRLEPYEYTIH